MASSTIIERSPTSIGYPGGGTCQYRSAISYVIVAMVTMYGGGGRSTAALYHPCIWIHASWIRGGSDASRDSTVDPDSSDRLCLSSCILALIVRMRAQDIRWSLHWRAALLVSMRLKVSGKIHAWQWHSCWGVLVISIWSLENMRSILSGVSGDLMGKHV